MSHRRLAGLVAAGLLTIAPLLTPAPASSAPDTSPIALRALFEVQRGQGVQVTLSGYSPVGRSMTFDIDRRFPMVGSVGEPSATSCEGDYCTATATYTAPAGTTAYEDTFLVFVTDSSGTQSFQGNYVSAHVTPPNGPVAHATMTESDQPAPGMESHVHPTVSGPQGSLISVSATSPAGQALTFAIQSPFDKGVMGPLDPPECSGGVCTATFPYYRPMFGGDDALVFSVTDESGRTDQARMNVPFAAPEKPTAEVPKHLPFHVGDTVSVPAELDFGGWSPTVGKVSVERTFVLCLRYDGVGLCNKEKRLPRETIDSTTPTGGPLSFEVPDPSQAPETDIAYKDFTAEYRLHWLSKPLHVDEAWKLNFEVVEDETTTQVTPSKTRIHRGDAFSIDLVVDSPAERPVTGGVVATARGHRLGFARVRAADNGVATLKVPAKATRDLPLGSLTVKARFSSDEYFAVSTATFDLQVRR